MSANFAIVELLLLVNEAISFACLFRDERMLIISSVSPELDIKRTKSFLLIIFFIYLDSRIGFV